MQSEVFCARLWDEGLAPKARRRNGWGAPIPSYSPLPCLLPRLSQEKPQPTITQKNHQERLSLGHLMAGLLLTSDVCPVSSSSAASNSSPGRGSLSVHMDRVREQQPEWDQRGPGAQVQHLERQKGTLRHCACGHAPSQLTSS